LRFLSLKKKNILRGKNRFFDEVASLMEAAATAAQQQEKLSNL